MSKQTKHKRIIKYENCNKDRFNRKRKIVLVFTYPSKRIWQVISSSQWNCSNRRWMC